MAPPSMTPFVRPADGRAQSIAPPSTIASAQPPRGRAQSMAPRGAPEPVQPTTTATEAQASSHTTAGSRQRSVDMLSEVTLRAEKAEKSLENVQSELKAVKRLVAALQKENKTHDETINTLTAELSDLRQEFTTLAGTVSQLQASRPLTAEQSTQLTKSQQTLIYVRS